jgi:cell wall-associated NlpC family hydrolase
LDEEEEESMLDQVELLRLIEAQYHKPYNRRAWTVADLYSKSPENFDCSSLVMWLYFQFGYKLPRVSQDQYTFCDKIKAKDIKIGDLFFLSKTQDPKRIDHVGMYKGSGMLVEAVGGSSVTMKVIYSIADKTMARTDWVGWGRVPLDIAEDRFFKWIKSYPAPIKT